MGQAKQRGSFEKRKAEAIVRNEENKRKRAKEAAVRRAERERRMTPEDRERRHKTRTMLAMATGLSVGAMGSAVGRDIDIL